MCLNSDRFYDQDKSESVLGILISEASQGDELAWEKIVNLYSGRIYKLIFANCQDHSLSEELTQETFVKVVKSLGSYKEKSKFTAWIFHIAMNCLRDEMRKRSRQSTVHMDFIEHSNLNLVFKECIGEEMKPLLTNLLMELSPKEKSLILMRHQALMSFSNISDALEVPLGTVLAMHHRLLQKIKARIEEKGLKLKDFLQLNISLGVTTNRKKR